MGEQGYYYWITARDEGKSYLIYGGLSEQEARDKGLEMLGGIDFKIKRLRTRNQQRASAMIKGGKLEETHSLKEAGKRIGHGKSIRKMRQKKAKANNPFKDILY